MVDRNFIDIEEIPCGFCRMEQGGDWSILAANRNFYKMAAYLERQSAQDLPSLEWFFLPADWSDTRQQLKVWEEAKQRELTLEGRAMGENGQPYAFQIQLSKDRREKGLVNALFFDITSRTETIEQLTQKNREQKLLLGHVDRFVIRFYLKNRVAKLSKEAVAELGLAETIRNFPESLLQTGPTPESREEYLKFHQRMLAGEPEGNAVLHIYSAGKTSNWYQCSYSLVYDKAGHARYSLISFENITEQREREIAYKKWSQYSKTQLENSILYFECNLNRDVMDQVVVQLVEQSYPPDSLRGYSQTIHEIGQSYVYGADRQSYAIFFDRENLIRHFQAGKRELKLEYQMTDAQGEPFWVLSLVQLLPDPYSNDVKAFITVKNIDEAKRRELLLRERSLLDSLTGVLNRGAVIEQINETLCESNHTDTHVLIMLDLDHFKQVNDQIGHCFGDQVLAGVAKVIKASLRKGDLVGRLGGDEFVIFLKEMPGGEPLKKKLDYLCDRLHMQCGQDHCISGSMGVAVYPRDATTFQDLYHKADLALYEAKGDGGNRYVFYQPEFYREKNTPMVEGEVPRL